MKKLKKKIELIKNKHLCLLFVALFFSFHSFAQSIFYQDVFYGGVTGGGFSSGVGNGASGQIIVNIDPSSTIKKAYLFCNRYGNAQPVGITLNSNIYNFNVSNQVGTNFLTFPSSTTTITCAIHAIDVTNDINPTQNIYNISYPNQFNTNISDKYGAFYLLVLYENSALQKVAVSVMLNKKDATSIVNYQINNLLQINTSNPVGLAIHSDILWDTPDDGSNVFVNGNNLGIIQGSDAVNSLWTGAGVKGHFYYQNNTLFGLDDDTPDSLMNGTDGLADIKSYLPNNSTSFNIDLIYESTQTRYNIYLAWFLTYTTPCDTFTTAATTNQDTVCAGENIQLNASGGATYSWYSSFSAFNDSTLANPVATPSQTTTYIVTIKNDSGCVKTEHVKVWVNPKPKPDTITITPQRCGSTDGSITVGNIPNGTPPFNYQLTNLTTSNIELQTSNIFNNLLAANYLLQITDSNGCQWQSDTLLLLEINDITANFSVYTIPWDFPFSTNPMGEAPLTVYTQNSSVNAGSFEWWVVSDESGVRDTVAQYSSATPLHTFEDGGTFEICLLAYNNIPVCGDTVCKTISITPNLGVDSLVFVVPNVFSPNHDGNNDNFVLQVQGADLLESLNVEIFNRWGQTVQSSEFDVQGLASAKGAFVIWDGTTNAGKEVPEGTYFYVINYTKIPASAGMTSEKESLKGSVTLLR